MNDYERLFKGIILAVQITDLLLLTCSECKEKIAKKDFDKLYSQCPLISLTYLNEFNCA